MKIDTKIVLAILELSLIPWIIGGFITYSAAHDQLDQSMFLRLDAIAEIQKSHLEDTVQDTLDMLSLFTTNAVLRVSVREANTRPSSSSEKAVQTALMNLRGNTRNVQRVFVTNAVGSIIASSDASLIGTDVSTEKYFKLGIQHPDGSHLAVEKSGSISQYAVGPIVSEGNTVGMVAMVVLGDDIVSVTQDLAGLGKTGEVLFVANDSSGNVEFISPTRSNPFAAFAVTVSKDRKDVPSVRALSGEEGVFNNMIDYRGIPVVAATRYMKETGWGIVVKMDLSEAFGPIMRMQQLFLLITVIVCLFIALVGISISKSISNPIKELTVLVGKISKDNLNESVVITSNDEIGVLGQTFNTMVSRLREVYATLEKNVEERTKDLAVKTEYARNSERAAFNIASDLKKEEDQLIKEKVKAENLANDLSKFKLALDNASDQVIITDPEGTVVYANAAVEKITGYKPEEALGKKSGALWKTPMPDEYYKNFWHTIKDQRRPFIGEIQNRRKNGELYTAMISVSPVLDEKGDVVFYVGLERDVTKEREIDKAKSEFISLASHQMRTPLTVINWYTEMMLEESGKFTKKQNSYLQEIYSAGRQMNEIIRTFLHILRLETGTMAMNPVEIDLVDIAKTTIGELKLTTEKRKLKISERYQESLPLVKADIELVRVVVQNLISNAAKYAFEGGDLVITIESVKRGSVSAGKMATEDSVLFSIRDTGIGISMRDSDKIFTKFFRAENAKKQDPNGNGIGLYMTKFMVDIAGGEVWFASEEGKETTFYLLLPVEGKRVVS
ncbi:MAG: ATP-binding protein [Minisyncoccia bacterium]